MRKLLGVLQVFHRGDENREHRSSGGTMQDAKIELAIRRRRLSSRSVDLRQDAKKLVA